MSPINDDTSAEKQLIGEWGISTPRETLEYKFEPQHRFTVKIKRPGEEPSSAWGYWDVLNGQLRMGTSINDCNGMPIKIEGDQFSLLKGSDPVAVHSRRRTAR